LAMLLSFRTIKTNDLNIKILFGKNDHV